MKKYGCITEGFPVIRMPFVVTGGAMIYIRIQVNALSGEKVPFALLIQFEISTSLTVPFEM